MRSRWSVFLVVAVCTSCALMTSLGDLSQDGGSSPDVVTSDGALGDSVIPFTCPAMTCELSKAWGAVNTIGINSTSASSPTLTADELTIVYGQSNGLGSSDLYIATRPSVTSSFGSAVKLTLGLDIAYDPTLSRDGLTLYFEGVTTWPGPAAIFKATRPTVTAAFGLPTSVVSGNGDNVSPFVTTDGDELWFATRTLSGPNGNYDIFHAPIANGTVGTQAAETELDTAFDDTHAVLTCDRLGVFFARTSDAGAQKVWSAQRSAATAAFNAPAQVPLSASGPVAPGWLSPDGCRLYVSVNGVVSVASR